MCTKPLRQDFINSLYINWIKSLILSLRRTIFNIDLSSVYLTRSGPKIPAVGPFGGGFLFGLDKFGHLMVNMPYLPNFRSLEPPHGLEEAPVVH